MKQASEAKEMAMKYQEQKEKCEGFLNMKFKVTAENGAEKEFEIGNSTLKEMRLFLEENQVQEDVFDIKADNIYYTIGIAGGNTTVHYHDDGCDRRLLSVANACKDRELMEKRALNETLNRLMWRFSMRNGGREIDWENDQIPKYSVFFNYHNNNFAIDYSFSCKNLSDVYFENHETARKCIEEVIKPFLAEHPDFEPNVY